MQQYYKFSPFNVKLSKCLPLRSGGPRNGYLSKPLNSPRPDAVVVSTRLLKVSRFSWGCSQNPKRSALSMVCIARHPLGLRSLLPVPQDSLQNHLHLWMNAKLLLSSTKTVNRVTQTDVLAQTNSNPQKITIRHYINLPFALREVFSFSLPKNGNSNKLEYISLLSLGRWDQLYIQRQSLQKTECCRLNKFFSQKI